MELVVSIRKKLRDFVLEAEFEVHDEVLALLGASGCGKSMTLKCIAGIERPDEGRILLNGRTLFDSKKGIDQSPQLRKVGYLFQNYALFPNMTIADNILFVAKGPRQEKERKMRENLARFGLSGLEHAYPPELSGGQQQRAAFVRILSSEAELLLLDEPFSALDSYLRWQLELELMEVLKSYEGTALLVSHDRNEVYRLAGRIAVMNHGGIEAIDGKERLFRNPGTLAATLLTGCKNVSAAHWEGAGVLFADEWEIPLHVGGEVFDGRSGVRYVGLRAHFLEYREEAGENTFPMEVVQVIEDTFSYLVMVRRKGTQAKPIRWELDKKEWRSICNGEIYLHFPAAHLILLER